MIEFIGWAGLFLLLIAWVPQTLETIREGRAPVNLLFILLYTFSSAFLAVYALMKHEMVFFVLNTLLTLGSGINLFYKIRPRNEKNHTGYTKS